MTKDLYPEYIKNWKDFKQKNSTVQKWAMIIIDILSEKI